MWKLGFISTQIEYFEAEKKSYKFAQVGNLIYGTLFQSLF